MDPELEELKRKKLEQLRQSYLEQAQGQRQGEEAEAGRQLEALEEIVKARLSKEALQRYGTLKLAHPETAVQLAVAVAQAIESGRLSGMLSDEQLVAALRQLSRLSQKNRETSITRKNK
ncbi:MAG TPA: DNA-binding protein [Candidatus Nanoarchaeia archaeon]|nr:DNA-binding protein [Candidatus Nanoarchaeia archaeon]